jgi:predicted nuclease of restriction endonuclease-like (RecB) superfamily
VAVDLFDRVAAILDQARAGVARAVNSGMVLAYWLIGREIVEELQGGDDRAAYGKRIVRDLSERLTARYGEGFGPLNLWLFRRFYLVFSHRAAAIAGIAEVPLPADPKVYPPGKLSAAGHNQPSPTSPIVYPAGKELPRPFHPGLSWSHYRALLSVEKPEAREFYESECAAAGWTKRELERQVHSFYYERLLASTDKKGMVLEQRGQRPATDPAEVLTSSTVLEFLGIPRSPRLQESTLEQAIMDNLQTFLLELGRGFSFVARQKLIRYEADEFYVDLVFYNYLLKCFVLIDLKIGKLTHQDVGQMDSYVRLYEDLHKVPGDNPTIGLILCSEKNETIARYSVLHENQQLFASKYRLHLPSEEELAAELKREIHMIEEGGI